MTTAAISQGATVAMGDLRSGASENGMCSGVDMLRVRC
jgi:hypothetical protein